MEREVCSTKKKNVCTRAGREFVYAKENSSSRNVGETMDLSSIGPFFFGKMHSIILEIEIMQGYIKGYLNDRSEIITPKSNWVTPMFFIFCQT